ncbi:MAG: helix-turn-helix transcriptional regulator [Acidimicrobiales bacterium]
MVTNAAQVSGAKRRLLERLKRVDAATAAELASDFGLTPTAVRQHLEDLARAGLVAAETAEPVGRGRPAQHWKLTPLAASLFPDHHADLTVSLLEAIRETLGDEGIDAVVDARTRTQLAAYRAVLPDPSSASVGERVRALAHVRTVEGYMAEAAPQGDEESYLLVEHHCPICEAAESCQGLCRGELELFRTVLGDDVTVDRTQHLMAGDLRCAYRVAPKRARQPSRRHPVAVTSG